MQTDTATKEHPILFSGPMVRAILAGRKTQTRRIVKPQPELRDDGWIWCPPSAKYNAKIDDWVPHARWRCGLNPTECGAAGIVQWCPYGQPGDRLWVRETWARWTDVKSFGCVVYQSDGTARRYLCDGDGEGDPVQLGKACKPVEPVARWRPSIHMPRWASRLTLEVTDVRVERLQEISEADAMAEGRSMTPGDPAGYFPDTWAAINGADSWHANPWVWVVSFKRVEGEK
jgi:hypothetical protein